MVERLPATACRLSRYSGEHRWGRKALIALLHRTQYSLRRLQSPFIERPLRRAPDKLAESGFFGHETGAFSGAAA